MINKSINIHNIWAIFLCSLLLISCGGNNSESKKESNQNTDLSLNENDINEETQDCTEENSVTLPEEKQRIVARIDETIQQSDEPFDWNKTDDGFFCESLLFGDGLITIGVSAELTETGNINLTQLEETLHAILPPPVIIQSKNTKLSYLTISMRDCDQLTTIRNLPIVDFVELNHSFSLDAISLDYQKKVVSAESCNLTEETDAPGDEITPERNPGLYDPDHSSISYTQYIEGISGAAATRMRRHNVDKVYDTYRFFGSEKVGIAVLDNGVLSEKINYLSAGSSSFLTEGYFTALFSTGFDGISPRPYDAFFLPYIIPALTKHGTDQSQQVYIMAPKATRMSVRAADLMILLLPHHAEGVTTAIMAVAENPDIKIISMSMGSAFYSHKVERAIDYFNSKDKIFVAAAGTTLKEIKSISGVVFPARLDSTISITAIKDTEKNNGELILSSDAHGGRQNDFVIDYAGASSPATSSAAGMIAVLWSINPSLTRNEIISILKESSTFYQQSGEKHPTLGWGKFDLLIAAEKVIETLTNN